LDNPRHSDADGVHTGSRRNGPDFVGESLRDSCGRSAEQRFSRRVFFLDMQLANQLVPLH
jgi:hypothetical protein